MYTLTVNGKQVQATANKKLLSFLRDDLRLTSAKDGCSQGACGTCTVLVDGKAIRVFQVKLDVRSKETLGLGFGGHICMCVRRKKCELDY